MHGRDAYKASRGVESGEGVPPSPADYRVSRERRKLPQRGPGRAPAEIEFGKVSKKPSGGTYFTEFSSTIL